ncbi:MAG: hypothetical protein JWP29_5557 [Rhodoferax sp.]|nr:hypothetical protein [Rhodoferax sp.]
MSRTDWVIVGKEKVQGTLRSEVTVESLFIIHHQITQPIL